MIQTMHELRKEYRLAALDESDVDPNPMAQFERWFSQAAQVSQSEANAMTLATATAQGVPAARMVLLKGVDDRGFRFFTCGSSRKGGELEENPVAALLFYWPELERQIRIEGRVERVSDEECAEYFQTRPQGSQIAAHIDAQSQVVPNRQFLEETVANARRRFGEEAVPPPDHWGGYRVVPTAFEFWQGRPSRIHDRLRYRPEGSGWVIERLGP